MKVRFIRDWKNYVKGAVFDEWPDGMAEILILRGFMEEVKEQPKQEPKQKRK